MFNDIRLAIRRLARTPGFSVLALLTLAFGIGANTALFTVVNSVLLSPAPGVTDAGNIAFVYTSDHSGPRYGQSSVPDIADLAARSDLFAQVAGVWPRALNVELRDETRQLQAELVSSDYFTVAGVGMQLGAGLQDGVVISHALWQRAFGSDPGVLGSAIRLDGQSYRVSGVAARGFRGLQAGAPVDFWIDLENSADFGITAENRAARDSRNIGIIARLRNGVTAEQAQTALVAHAARMAEQYPGSWLDVRNEVRRITVLAEHEARVSPTLRGSALRLLLMLGGAVGLVMLTCCANVASLMLTRAYGRARETAVRYALGATRMHVMRGVVTESLLLAGAGGALSLLVARWGVDLLRARATGLPVALDYNLAIDARVFAFAFGVSLLAATLFGVLPALRASRSRLFDVMRSERTVVSAGRGLSARDGLVIVQLAFSVVLLTGAGLLVRTLLEAQRVDAGLDPRDVTVMRVDFSPVTQDRERARTLALQLTERVRGLSAVEGAAIAERIPLSGVRGRRTVQVAGYTPAPGEEMEFPFNSVDGAYFDVVGLPLVAGRAVERAGEIVVNESFARRFFADRSPLGQVVSIGDAHHTVTGVARDGKYWAIDEEPRPYYYLPYEAWGNSTVLHVRSPADVSAALRAVVKEVAPGASITMLDSMAGQMRNTLAAQSFAGSILALLALLAGTLAIVGLYGVTAYVVAQRIPEIGVRVALGARPLDVARLVVVRGLIIGALGVTTGLAAAALGTRSLQGLLFGVTPLDPGTYAAVVGIVIAAVLLASYIPARRAARVDPMVALKR